MEDIKKEQEKQQEDLLSKISHNPPSISSELRNTLGLLDKHGAEACFNYLKDVVTLERFEQLHAENEIE